MFKLNFKLLILFDKFVFLNEVILYSLFNWFFELSSSRYFVDIVDSFIRILTFFLVWG